MTGEVYYAEIREDRTGYQEVFVGVFSSTSKAIEAVQKTLEADYANDISIDPPTAMGDSVIIETSKCVFGQVYAFKIDEVVSHNA